MTEDLVAILWCWKCSGLGPDSLSLLYTTCIKSL